MALELSGGGEGSGAAATGGGMSAPAGSSAAPPNGALAPTSAAPAAASGAAPNVARNPRPAAPPVTAQTKSDPSPPVPARKKTEPAPIAQSPAEPTPSVDKRPEPFTAKEPDSLPEIGTEESSEAAGALSAENPQDLDQIAGSGNGPQSGAANHQQGAGKGSGAPGSGAAGPPGVGGGGGAGGGGGNLITFGAPGGPGIVRMAKPRYPDEAKRLGKEGIVVMKLSLDETGAVYDVEILQGAGFGMDEASREAVMLSRFRPASVQGRPVASQAILPIHFKLR